MSEGGYSRRDYAEDMPDSVQATSVTAATNQRKTGPTVPMHSVDWDEEESDGHDSDEAAVDGYCGGSRDSREPDDTADKLAEKFSGYQ